jgi:hypothetical protein
MGDVVNRSSKPRCLSGFENDAEEIAFEGRYHVISGKVAGC